MKNILKIGALSLGLLLAVVALNKTNAQSPNGDVTLQIVGQSGYCVVGYNVPFGQTGFSYNAYSITTGFNTLSGTTTWFCNDANGAIPWTVSISADPVNNITTNNPAHSIPTSRLQIRNDTATVTAGNCTPNVGSSQGNPLALTSQVVLFGKTSATGEVCTIETQNVQMTIYLTGSQALGSYSGNLTISIPGWAQ